MMCFIVRFDTSDTIYGPLVKMNKKHTYKYIYFSYCNAVEFNLPPCEYFKVVDMKIYNLV